MEEMAGVGYAYQLWRPCQPGYPGEHRGRIDDLVGFALQKMGKGGEPILTAIKYLERLVFRLMAMIMWVAPVGAFGAMAALVGATGLGSLKAVGFADAVAGLVSP